MSRQKSQRFVLVRLFSVLLKQRAADSSEQANKLPTLLQHPSIDNSDAWPYYWQKLGQSWRIEPEIDKKRQDYLTKRRTISADIKRGIFPFKGIKLSRADIEWLLATHENGRGPVDWSDGSQRGRMGLDLRGADLREVNLSRLPLARLYAGLLWHEWYSATEEQRDMAVVLMDGAVLTDAQLEEAILSGARLKRADPSWALLEGANLSWALLEDANLVGSKLNRAFLIETRLKGADLSRAQLERADLENVKLGDAKHIGPRLVDVLWGNVNLAIVKWSQVDMLGDEHEARQKKHIEDSAHMVYTAGIRDEHEARQKKHMGEVKDRDIRLREFETAVRANRQLAVALQTQGVNEQAERFAYRAQILQKKVFWFNILQGEVKFRQRIQSFGAWFFSWFLFLLAGYGYRPGRSIIAYLLVIGLFSMAYFALGNLAWYEALVVSLTAFHGRGFFSQQFKPGDPQSFIAAAEAVVGLIIEISFIVTFTQRFFRK